jgi:hypothetical protein
MKGDQANSARSAGPLSPGLFDGVFFCGRTPEHFAKFEQMFRQLPFASSIPVSFRSWWTVTDRYRREWQAELEQGVYDSAPFNAHFLLTNCHPDDLQDGAQIVAPVFMVLASRGDKGAIQFQDEIVSGRAYYGELIDPVRHSFGDLVGSERKLAA